MKNAMFFSSLAAFMVAIACSGNPPPTEPDNITDPTNPDPTNPDPNIGDPPVDPGDPPVDPPVKMITRGLAPFNPGNNPIFVDDRETGLMISETTPVMVSVAEGTHRIEYRDRDSGRLLARADNVEFSTRTAMVMVSDEVRRDFTGNWYRRRTPHSGGFYWDNVWDCDNPNTPGTRVCVVGQNSQYTVYGVYPNDLLGLCVDPTDIAAALAEGRAPRIVATPECNNLVGWGQTVDDANGLKGREIVDYAMDLRDPDRTIFREEWLLRVPAS